MSAITLTTELEAINTMLDAAGESPVSTLEDSGLDDVAQAIKILNQVSREVQIKGWSFNEEKEYELVPEAVTGFITLPTNCLSFDAQKETFKSNSADTIQRGLRLYDRKNHTYVFTETIKGEIIFLLGWEELPETARTYFMIKAARLYQTRALGSDTLHKFSETDEFNARATFMRENIKKHDGNFFKDSWSVNAALCR